MGPIESELPGLPTPRENERRQDQSECNNFVATLGCQSPFQDRYHLYRLQALLGCFLKFAIGIVIYSFPDRKTRLPLAMADLSIVFLSDILLIFLDLVESRSRAGDRWP